MSVGLTLIGAIFATVGFFATVYGLVILFTEGRRAKAKPRLGLAPGVGPGTLSVWVNWDPSLFNLKIYRLRISHVSPENKAKEGTFTVTFENPQTEPFIQPIEMPGAFREMLERETSERSLFTFEFRTVDEMSLFLNCHLKKAKKIYQGLKTKRPQISHVLPLMTQDAATVFSLDFEELQARKKRMKNLEAAAKAKAAKAAAAKPAPAPAAAPIKPAPAPAAPQAKVEAAVEAKVSPPPKVEDKVAPVPVAAEARPVDKAAVEDKPNGAKPDPAKSGATARSVRDVVSESNKNRPE